MISQRGKPEASPNAEFIHYFDDNPKERGAINRGEVSERLLCHFKGYHVKYTNETNKVTCPACQQLLTRRLMHLAGKLETS